jgi:hypothetical protein
MTLLQNPQLNDGDNELLSAYIDNQLAAGERGALEERLRHEPGLQAALEDLRGTVAVLRELDPLPLPRSFTLDPAAFARRPSPWFGWLRLGATLASVLLAMTFAVDLVGRGGGMSTSAPAAAPAPQSSDSAAAERSALMLATAAPAAMATAAPAPPAPAAAPMAAAPTAAPMAAAEAPEPTAAPMAAAAPAPEPTAAPAADMALPTQTALPNADAQNSETTITEPGTLESAPAAEATPAPFGYTPPSVGEGPLPAEPAGGQAPAPQAQEEAKLQPAPQPAIRPLRLVQIGLASLVLLLGLAAIWVRRRGR